MNGLNENADEVSRHANMIAALAASFETEFDLPDSGGSSGACYDALVSAAESLRKYQRALYDLMVKTAQYLQAKGASITENDTLQAMELLKESNFFTIGG